MSDPIRVLYVANEPGSDDPVGATPERGSGRIVVETACDPSEALDRLEDPGVDCVVSAYDIPGGNGIEFLEAVREDHPELPFLLVTDPGDGEVAGEALAAGASDLLRRDDVTDRPAILANRIENAVGKYRAERRADRAEEEYRLVAETATDAFWTLDVETGGTRMFGLHEFGYDERDPDREWWKRRLHPEDRERVLDRDGELLAGRPEAFDEWEGGRGQFENEYRWRRADGSYADCLERGVVVFEDGEPVRVVGTMTDVTERKERERRRERDETCRRRLYRIGADTSLGDDERVDRLLELGCERLGVENGHVARIDREAGTHEIVHAAGSDLVEVGETTDLDETFCRRTIEVDDGLAVHDAAESGWADDPAHRRWDIGCYLGAKVLVEGTLRGTVCFADREPRGAPFTNADRAFVDLVARLISQTFERLEHTAELRVRERAMDAAPIGITIGDASRPDNPIVYANESFERLTGYPESAILGRNCRFLQGEETDPEPVAEMRAAIDADRPVSVDLVNYRRDGRRFWNRVDVAPVRDDDGKVTHYVGFQRDVTDETVREQRLEVLNRIIRHNLRNKMTVIEGYAVMAREETDDGDVEPKLDRVLEASKDLIGLGEHAHEIERALRRAGGPSEAVPVAERIEILASKYRDRFPEARIEVDVGEGDWGRVSAGVITAIEEAIANGLEHNDADEPRIGIRISDPAEGSLIEIVVEDDAPGIPERERKALDRGETPLRHGDRLGLWLIRWLVVNEGGSISFESKAPRGTVVRMRVPTAADQEPGNGSDSDPRSTDTSAPGN